MASAGAVESGDAVAHFQSLFGVKFQGSKVRGVSCE